MASKWIRRSTRLAIYHRDGFACRYCGDESALTLDHVVPVSAGGSNQPRNLATACVRCNSSKQDITTRKWYARLRSWGIDTKRMQRELRRALARPIDRMEGNRLASSGARFEAGRKESS